MEEKQEYAPTRKELTRIAWGMLLVALAAIAAVFVGLSLSAGLL